MIKIVKRILFRRSGTRNMFRNRDSMGASTSSSERGTAAYRLLSAFPRAGGRPSPHGAGIVSTSSTCTLDGPDCRLARRRARATVNGRVSSPRPSILTRPRFATRPCARRISGVDLVADVEGLERVEVHHHVLHAERVSEALRLRGAAVDRGLATLEARRDVAACALCPSCPGRRSSRPCRAMPRPTRRRAFFEPGAGFRSWIFIVRPLRR